VLVARADGSDGGGGLPGRGAGHARLWRHRCATRLRSGGLGVSRHGRAGQVAIEAAGATLKKAALEASAATTRKVVLFTEDLLRGYRVDVQHLGKWHSLCRREGDYKILKSDQVLPIAPDEGYVKGASTTGDSGDDH
jgi:hypothetical protein